MSKLQLLLILLIVLILLKDTVFTESFRTFFEPSDNYNLFNKVWFYNSLRNTIGCNPIMY